MPNLRQRIGAVLTERLNRRIPTPDLQVVLDELMSAAAHSRTDMCLHEWRENNGVIFCMQCGQPQVDPMITNFRNRIRLLVPSPEQADELDLEFDRMFNTYIGLVRGNQTINSENQNKIINERVEDTLAEVESYVMSSVQNEKIKFNREKGKNPEYNLGWNNGRLAAFDHVGQMIHNMFRFGREGIGRPHQNNNDQELVRPTRFPSTPHIVPNLRVPNDSMRVINSFGGTNGNGGSGGGGGTTRPTTASEQIRQAQERARQSTAREFPTQAMADP